MQTFLPYPDFEQSAIVLDRQRLGKQRVECLQVLKAIGDSGYGWQNHPTVNMWRGHSGALAQYGILICQEWLRRGYKDSCLFKIQELNVSSITVLPPWLGNEQLHSSHRAALLAKDYEHYSQFGWSEEPRIEYFWPRE